MEDDDEGGCEIILSMISQFPYDSFFNAGGLLYFFRSYKETEHNRVYTFLCKRGVKKLNTQPEHMIF